MYIKYQVVRSCVPAYIEATPLIHPIKHFLNYCAEATLNKLNSEFVLAVFCDLSKAFDVTNHDILLHKLNLYGIRGIVNDWFRDYLSNRIQYVQFKNKNSSLLSIYCGVPQGSILVPLLYLAYVNDINQSCNGNILSFADDTTMFYLIVILRPYMRRQTNK